MHNTWRDLADELSDDQRAELVRDERRAVDRAWLLKHARDLAAENLTHRVMFPPLPVGAAPLLEPGEGVRDFAHPRCEFAGVVVQVGGCQHSDGQIEGGHVWVHTPEDATLTAGEARQLAALLLDAADLADG